MEGPPTGHAEGRFSLPSGVHLYYQRWRPRTPPRATVALVPGFGAHSGLYEGLGVELVRSGIALYGLDPRGMGRSSGRRGYFKHWNDYLEDLEAFLRLVGGHEPSSPLFLAGESSGGLVALEYAERHPEGVYGVIALGPQLDMPEISPFLRALGRVMARVLPRNPIEIPWDFTQDTRDPEAIRRFEEDPLLRAKGRARLGVHMPAAIARTHAGARCLALPLLILHGGADRGAPPEGSRAFFDAVTYEDKELREYEGALHVLTHDLCADEVTRDIIRWIERHL